MSGDRADGPYTPSLTDMQADWRHLCETIGVRLAGTKNERRAADWIEARFLAAGCARTALEPFPCRSARSSRARVLVLDGHTWKEVETAAVVGTGNTPGRTPREGEIRWIEMPEQMTQISGTALKGRIAILFGPLPTDVALHKRLVRADPLAVIHVDHRLPFNWVKHDGTYPLWVKRHGMPPTVTVPYMEAWGWKRAGITRARVQVRQETVTAESQNVRAELPGTDPAAGIIMLTAHHDTQSGNPGADDNASGVVAILELARALARKRRKRTIRFVSFGTEEQLSVGAAAYARAHASEMDRISLVLNYDSISSHLGHFKMHCAANQTLNRFGASRLRASGLPVVMTNEVSPFADHFIFTAHEVAAFWLTRENFPGGRWQHHSIHDNMDNVSVQATAEAVQASAALVERLAALPESSFAFNPGARQQELTRKLARELYGAKGRRRALSARCAAPRIAESLVRVRPSRLRPSRKGPRTLSSRDISLHR